MWLKPRERTQLGFFMSVQTYRLCGALKAFPSGEPETSKDLRQGGAVLNVCCSPRLLLLHVLLKDGQGELAVSLR